MTPRSPGPPNQTTTTPHRGVRRLAEAQRAGVARSAKAMVRALHPRAELDVDRRRRAHPRRLVQLAVRLDLEHRDRVGVLIADVQERPGRVDVHPPRPLSLGRLPGEYLELARVGIDGVHRDAVVAAIRVVEELAARMDPDLGGGVGALETLR